MCTFVQSQIANRTRSAAAPSAAARAASHTHGITHSITHSITSVGHEDELQTSPLLWQAELEWYTAIRVVVLVDVREVNMVVFDCSGRFDRCFWPHNIFYAGMVRVLQEPTHILEHPQIWPLSYWALDTLTSGVTYCMDDTSGQPADGVKSGLLMQAHDD